jgi:glycosyltransferase involved in cell wall biosynthesis
VKTNNRLAVAMIEPLGGHAGMSGYDLGLCRGLIAAGCRVSWYTCDLTVVPEAEGIRFLPVFRGVYGSESKLLRGMRFVAGTLKAYASVLARGEQICHLHVFHSSLEELLLVAVAKAMWRRVLVTVHDVDPFSRERGSGEWVLRRICCWADRVIVHNASSREALLARVGFAAAKVRVVAHGNYLAPLGPSALDYPCMARRRLAIEPSRRVVLFFGHIKQVKGLDLLLDAIADVSRELPEVLLLVAGRPWKSDFQTYQAQIDRLGIGSHCKLRLDFIPDDDVPDYFAAADLVVLPYRRIYQSGVILQAMSFGRAVLASDLPAMQEIVTHGENGLLFERDSATALARALAHALGDRPRLEAIGRRAREYVQRQHDWSAIGAQTAAIYAEIGAHREWDRP